MLAQVAQAKARMALPKNKKKGEDGEEEKPVFEVPAEEKLFKGDPNDRKALLRHKQRVKASILRTASHLPFTQYGGWACTHCLGLRRHACLGNQLLLRLAEQAS